MAESDVVTVEVAGIDMTPQDAEGLRQAFAELDTDGNGTLDKKEFKKFMIIAKKEHIADRIFPVVDKDHSGSISFEEFVEFLVSMMEIVKNKDGTRYMTMLFNACDKGKKGYLNKKEFVKFAKLADAKVGFFQRSRHFKEWDSDGNGRIELEELVSKFNFKIN